MAVAAGILFTYSTLYPERASRVLDPLVQQLTDKRKAGDYAAAASIESIFKENSGDLLEREKVEESLRVLGQHTVIKGNIVYDKLANCRLVRRYA